MKSTVVIDLNVFVKILLGSPANQKIYEAIQTEKFHLAFSADLLKNLADVLIRPHLKLELKDIEHLLNILKEKAIIVEPKTKINVCRDPSDNIILETAISAKASIIITNDKDLLVLNPFQNISILSTMEFLEKTAS